MQIVIEYLENQNIQQEDIPFKVVCNSLIDKIEYKNILTAKDVKLTYFESKELNPKDNIEIVDSSWILPNNNLNNVTGHYFTNSMTVKSEYKELMFTDVVSFQNDEVTPLWYIHKSNRITYVESIERLSSSNLIKNSIDAGYKITNGILYTNYQNQYDYKNDSFDIFLVNGKNVSGQSFTELLNTGYAIDKMQWEDINPETGELKNSVYIQEQDFNGDYIYSINFAEGFSQRLCNNGLNGYYYKISGSNKIEILEPDTLNGQDPWNPRIRNGNHKTRIGSKNYLYCIPEYYKQPYNPIFPLILVTEKDCFKVTDNIIKLSPSRFTLNPEQNIHLDILIFDYNENLIKGYTSDYTKANIQIYNSEVNWEYGAIESADERNGFVYLNQSISLNNEDIIKATYYTYAEDFLMQNLNVNPVYNKYNDCRYVIYLKPIDITQSITYDANIKRLFYMIVDNKNRIIYKSDSQESETEYNTFKTNKCYPNNSDYSYLILGDIYYKDESTLDDCFSFDLRKKNKFVKDEIFKENYRTLQSKFGYGEKGQRIKRTNVKLAACSELVFQKNEEEFLSEFNALDSYQVVRFKNNPSLNFSVSSYEKIESLSRLILQWRYQGPGNYEITGKETTGNNSVITIDSSFHRFLKPSSKYTYYHLIENDTLTNKEFEWTLTYTPDNTKSSFQEVYQETILTNFTEYNMSPS